MAEAFGHDVGQGRIVIRQKVSQSDLAAMAGIARENVSRVLVSRSWRSHRQRTPAGETVRPRFLTSLATRT
jgi:hypothetical protein